jgi:hypothetical protein
MVHDELAGWIGSFERYGAGVASRGFFLQSWNGGEHLKDRVGKGKDDPDAEICVDNLALCILGGIQPDRLLEISKQGSLTSDGLLQRALPCLLQAAKRGDEYHPVAEAEAEYNKLIKSIYAAPPETYRFNQDALEVRDRVNDYLFKLAQVDGFSPALIGAIGKLRGYFARICLVLEVARQHEPRRPAGEPVAKAFKHLPVTAIGVGLPGSKAISRVTAEAAEKILRQFLLPHIFGLYDVVIDGGEDRDRVRAIGDFILASDKDRLRPSDFTAGVRALRGQPEQKVREWIGRFCALGWLEAEVNPYWPSLPPKAWRVFPGLREYFAERRQQAEAARVEVHALLKAGGPPQSSGSGGGSGNGSAAKV